MTRPWRNCKASLVLIDEINALWPNRDKTSDGTIGDAAHAARTSDHNPWVVVDGIGVVRARDIDKDGIPAAELAEYLRTLGARRDPRLHPGGYVIFNRRITAPDFSGWRTYTGSNPHTSHVHVSFSTERAGFDSAASWGLAARFRPASPDLLAPPRPPLEDDDMPIIIKCESIKGGPIWTGLLSGGVLIGPLSTGELQSLEANHRNHPNAWVQWVERSTWDALAARSARTA